MYNGGNNWFKSSSGEVFRVGTDGAISQFGNCPTPTATPTRTSTPTLTATATPTLTNTPTLTATPTLTNTPAPNSMGLASEYETSEEACAGTTTIQTVTYSGNLTIETVLDNFGGVSGNTGFFKIITNSLEPQYVGQVLGVNDNNAVVSIENICGTLYYTLNPCTGGDPLYDTTITPISTNQRYVDPISGNFWVWDNAAGTSSPQQTVNGSLQIVSGQSGCP